MNLAERAIEQEWFESGLPALAPKVSSSLHAPKKVLNCSTDKHLICMQVYSPERAVQSCH